MDKIERLMGEFHYIEEYAYIEENIITPLNKVLSGELKRTDEWFWKKMEHFVDVCFHHHHQGFLYAGIYPILKKYVFRELDLFEHPNYSLLAFIRNLMERNSEFGFWMKYRDVRQMVDIWAKDAKKTNRSDWHFTHILECMISTEYEGNWTELKSFIKERLLWEDLEGNQWGLKVYCIFHAFVVIGSSGRSLEEKMKLFKLFQEKWDFLRFLYSAILKRVVGCGYINFLQINNHVKSYTDYHTYLHLYYPIVMENKDIICLRGTNREKLDASLDTIRVIIGSVTPSRDLDELSQILFPKSMKQYLEKHRLKSYPEVVAELDTFKKEMNEYKLQMNLQVQKMADQLKMMATASVSISVIADELMLLSAGVAWEVFIQLNGMLVENEAWINHAGEIRKRIRQKMNDKHLTIQATNYYESGANHNDHQKHLHVTNDKKQIEKS